MGIGITFLVCAGERMFGSSAILMTNRKTPRCMTNDIDGAEVTLCVTHVHSDMVRHQRLSLSASSTTDGARAGRSSFGTVEVFV